MTILFSVKSDAYRRIGLGRTAKKLLKTSWNIGQGQLPLNFHPKFPFLVGIVQNYKQSTDSMKK